jgi:trans-aconitate methyltransferase
MVPRGHVLGIDASPDMIALAGQLAGPNLAFRRLDATQLDYERQFDLIYSNAALHWVPDHRRLLRGSAAALKPGGAIRWNFGGAGNCANLIASLRVVMARPPYEALFAGFAWPWFMPSREAYVAMLADAGFHDVQVRDENRDKLFADSAQMIAWMDQPCLVPFLSHLPVAARAGFRDRVIDEMTDRCLRPDGRCFETFRRLDVRATR